MKERLNETNRMRKLMGLPLITEQANNRTENYTVKKGDSLSLIAKSFNEDKKCKISWQSIYDNNKKVIEDAQNKNGGVKTCSDSWCKGRETPSPNLIFPGTVLRIPTGSCGEKEIQQKGKEVERQEKNSVSLMKSLKDASTYPKYTESLG
jgi:LysM repeat protein